MKHKVRLVIGIVLLALGLFLFIWSGGTAVSSNPYTSALLSFSQKGQDILLINNVGKFLSIFGALVIIICIVSNIYSSRVAKSAAPGQASSDFCICPSCGVKVDRKMDKCPNCGKELK